MSPHVGNFVQDLVEMAKATEDLPKFKAEVERLSGMVEDYAKQVQDRELAIIGYKEQIEGLHSTVRSLEVERDDASFRVLEAEDREHGILLLARNMQNDLAVIMNRLDPPKPQPEPEKEPEHVAVHKWDEPKDQSATDPTANTMTTNSSETASSASSQDTAHTSTSEEAPKSDANPPSGSTSLSPISGEKDGKEEVVNKGPYFGKRYGDYSAYLSIHEWIDGGGTEADYFNAPIHKARF